ncbi:SWIM zinc finger family protein [Streptomyces sp. NPDC046465]|uniref:SWIM zinc finger family protein n=1 Tax=Streptomyces sp. NPDC046465 TaxID=3155810 RepID=UPI003402C3CA
MTTDPMTAPPAPPAPSTLPTPPTPPARPALPPVAAEVAATALDPLPARLRKRVDGAVAKAAAWPVDTTADGAGTVVRAVVRVDDETLVTLSAPQGIVAAAEDATCTCLLAPACLHRAAVLLRAPLAEEPPTEGSPAPPDMTPARDSAPAAATPTAPSTPLTPFTPLTPLTPAQSTATRALWAAARDVLVAGTGVGGAGAVHRAGLLHAAHSARLTGLHRAPAAAVRAAQRLGEAASGDPGFRLAELVSELAELLHVLRGLRGLRATEAAEPALVGPARRAYRPERPLRLHGLFTEPVVTASGHAGAVTYALAPDGRLRTLSDVAPGDPDRVRQAAASPVPGGCALSLRDLGDGGGVTLTGPTVSPDGRIGAGRTVRSARAQGAAWTETPLAPLWQRPPHTQLATGLAWLGTPVEERTAAGGNLVFLRGTVAARGLAVSDGPTLRLLAPDERPELPYAENLRLIASRVGLPLRVVARIDPERPGGVLALAAAWPGPDGRPLRADLGLRNLNRSQFPPHSSLPSPTSPSAPPADPPALPLELSLLRRAVDRAAAGGRPVAAADTGDELPRRLRSVGLTTGAECARRLTATAADRTHDALGRLRPADPDAYAEAWLAAHLYTRAATASLLTAAWTQAPEAPARH